MRNFDSRFLISGNTRIGDGDSPKHGGSEIGGLGDRVHISRFEADLGRKAMIVSTCAKRDQGEEYGEASYTRRHRWYVVTFFLPPNRFLVTKQKACFREYHISRFTRRQFCGSGLP